MNMKWRSRQQVEEVVPDHQRHIREAWNHLMVIMTHIPGDKPGSLPHPDQADPDPDPNPDPDPDPDPFVFLRCPLMISVSK